MVVTSDALFDRPSLTSQGAGVGFAVGRVDATLGRDDFNLTFMIFFGELLYDVGYQKKHIRLHGRG